MNVWPRGEDVVVFSETAVPFTFSIRCFSESCCGCSETHNHVLRNLCSDPWVAHFCHTSLLIFTFSNCAIALRPLWSSKSFKNDRFHKHSWSAPFLFWSINIKFSSKTTGFISLFGVPLFCCRGSIFTILHISKVVLNFCYVHGSFDFTYISELLYFQRKTTHFATFTDSMFWTNFRNLHISNVILKKWPVHYSLSSSIFQNCCIS